MAKALSGIISSKNIQELIKQVEQMIPDKKLLKKYESLLEKKLHDLHAAEKLDEILKPLRQKLEKSCLKPLEAKNLQEFSQRVVTVVRVQAKKQKKNIEKRLGKKLPTVKKKASSSKKRKTPPRKASV